VVAPVCQAAVRNMGSPPPGPPSNHPVRNGVGERVRHSPATFDRASTFLAAPSPRTPTWPRLLDRIVSAGTWTLPRCLPRSAAYTDSQSTQARMRRTAIPRNRFSRPRDRTQPASPLVLILRWRRGTRGFLRRLQWRRRRGASALSTFPPLGALLPI